jgi:DNA-directed RNA polymerase subunit RPC12/RpoP
MSEGPQICPSCSSAVSSQVKFCGQCGTPLSSNQIAKTTEKVFACPYCSAPLKKEPKRKTKCPSCQKPIFIKSRPSDRTKRLVTQEQAEDIEDEWSIHYELEQLPEVDKKRFEQIRARQTKECGGERPKELHRALHTIRWDSYRREEAESLKIGNYVLFRNARLNEASLLDEEIRKGEGNVKESLAIYLELCYIDINGPQYSTERERAQYNEAAFDPSQDFLAPGIVTSANIYIEQLGSTLAETKTLFREHVSTYLRGLRMPVSIEKAWNQLEPDLIFNSG